jgi:hypothetical protein
MRWQRKPWSKDGDERVRRRILLFPKCIKMEYRWLEYAEWLERYEISGLMCGGHDMWVPIRWLD